MPTGHHVLTDASLVWNAVDLSADVKSIELSYTVAEEDDSTMGDTAVGRLTGLEDVTGSITFKQNYDASKVDATMMASKRSAVTITIKAASGAVAVTNPSFSGPGFWTSYPPISGDHGSAHEVSVSFVGSDTWTRATS